jgi:hypothetical protein
MAWRGVFLPEPLGRNTSRQMREPCISRRVLSDIVVVRRSACMVRIMKTLFVVCSMYIYNDGNI